ncbi:hypothetical protein AAIB41_02765 [Brucella sp. BE17]|uniref:hypothetical protein n=1 Tax=Brucella sp. BE17 TaxID=3142977 RepID=UPI0031BA63DF
MSAQATLHIIWLPMLVRLLALVFAIASVVGVIAFFAFESLYPYRWHLMVGGALGSGIFGWIGDRISPTREIIAKVRDELNRDGTLSADREEQNNAG